jgi:hypothetical protein
VSEDAVADGYADRAAEEIASLASPGAEPVTKVTG